MKKTGKHFENIVSWINQCLHTNARVTPNDKIRDKQSGRLRQIDISLRFVDGPSKLLGIVEVRDQKRPVGEPYIDEIKSKFEAIGANKAFIVSRSGFTAPAITKAKNIGIDLFTFKTAIKYNWSKSLKYFKGFFVHSIRSKNITIFLLEQESQTIIDVHKSLKNAFENSEYDRIIFNDSNSKPIKSINDVYNTCLNSNSKTLFSKLSVGEKNCKQLSLIVDFCEIDPIYFRTIGNKLMRVEKVGLQGKFWIEEDYSKATYHQYKSIEDQSTVAEIITANKIPGYDIKMLIENPNDTSVDRKMHIKIKKKS